MKAYKLEILIVNHDELTADEIVSELESSRFTNRCINPQVMGIAEADIGEWDNDHPLNRVDLQYAEYNRLFK